MRKKTVAFMVIVKVPETMPVEEIRKELHNSIEFGSPEINLQYIIPDARE